MSIVATTNKFRTDDVEEAVPVDVSIPLHNAMELYVIYGEAGLEALLNVDYTITLNEADWSNFVFTPLESLIDKINAQIVAVPTDRNTVLMVRELALTTPSTPQASRDTTFVSREHDRTIMRLQQIEEQIHRTVRIGINDETDPDLTLPPYQAGQVIMWHPLELRLTSSGDVVFQGLSAYEVAVENGFVGDEADWLASLESTVPGPGGLSAYQIAVNNGFVGNEAAWLASLEGTDGTNGLVTSIVGGTNVTIDSTNPAAPIVNATGATTGQIIALILGLA